MDRLKKYNFKDEHGHPLENCKDYIDIFTENETALSAMQRAMVWWRNRGRETQGLLDEAVKVSRAQAGNFVAMKHRTEEAEAKLQSHAPDGHNVTNAQYVAMRQRVEEAEQDRDVMRRQVKAIDKKLDEFSFGATPDALEATRLYLLYQAKYENVAVERDAAISRAERAEEALLVMLLAISDVTT